MGKSPKEISRKTESKSGRSALVKEIEKVWPWLAACAVLGGSGRAALAQMAASRSHQRTRPKRAKGNRRVAEMTGVSEGGVHDHA
jgi:hypothetical protein